jgi:hypothetical protein
MPSMYKALGSIPEPEREQGAHVFRDFHYLFHSHRMKLRLREDTRLEQRLQREVDVCFQC